MKKAISLLVCLLLTVSLAACNGGESAVSGVSETEPTTTASTKSEQTTANNLTLSGDKATLDGQALEEFDYTWHCDPAHEEPYYSGDEPSTDAAAYVAHDIVYYPEIEESAFKKEEYDGETEWVTHYTAEGLSDYLFSTLPVLGNDLPTEMMHTAEEAYKNPVLHITKPGEYVLSGEWNGQVLVDLGDSDEVFADETAKVTLVLNGADITCTVAPGVMFKSVYECDNTWEDREEYGNDVDLSNAGAKVILADGTENNVTGTNVFRLLKAKYKKEGSTVQKKLAKTDGAFYSYMSMVIDGEKQKTGILNVNAPDYEGLDSELHLTIDGGYIHIVSADDGINVNEDGVSVFTVNDGHLVIFAGQGAEGDVVDSNGYITVNGGVIAGATPSVSDDILDCDCEKKVSDTATIIENKAGIEGGGMQPPQGGMPQGERPDEPPQGGMSQGEPPQGQPPELPNR